MWHVVRFSKENSVAAIPHSWYLESTSESYWPPKSVSSNKLNRMIEARVDPSPNWSLWGVVLLGSYDEYETALKKSKKAQLTDELSSNMENDKIRKKRARKRNPKYSSADSSGHSSDDPNMYPSFKKLQSMDLRKPRPPLRDSLSSSNDEASICNRSKSYSPKVTSQSLGQSNLKRRSHSFSPTTATNNHAASLSGMNKLFVRSLKKNAERTSSALTHEVLSGCRSSGTTEGTCHQSDLLSGTNIQTSIMERPNTVAIDQPSTSKIDKSVTEVRSGTVENDGVLNDEEFKRSVLNELSHLHLKLNVVIDSMSSIMKAQNSFSSVSGNGKENAMKHKLPLATMEELLELEEWLKDERNFKIMMSELRRVGGHTYAQATRKLLYKTMTDLVAVQYSWDGLKKKAAFKKLSLSHCILDAIKTQFQAVSETEIIMVIKLWLVKAKERSSKAKTATTEDGPPDDIVV